MIALQLSRHGHGRIICRHRALVRSAKTILFVVPCFIQFLWIILHLPLERDSFALFSVPFTPSTAEYRNGTLSVSKLMVPPDFIKEARNQIENEISLRFNWTDLQPLSPLARRMASHQANCQLPLGGFRFRNRFGLGSDLHVYSQALCNAMELQVRVRTVAPWIWADKRSCAASLDIAMASDMMCYFPKSEVVCTEDLKLSRWNDLIEYNISRGRGRVRNECSSIIQSPSTAAEVRAAASEFLFAGVSATVQEEAERQLNLVFSRRPKLSRIASSKSGNSIVGVPSDLITVHVRWGDKVDEMPLVPIHKYIEAVKDILRYRGRPLDYAANVYLATEDPVAYAEFIFLSPPEWTIYVDQYFLEMLPFRRDVYNGSPLMSQDLKGRPGMVALGSLLVAMEANDFVLTTASNWSRLINELRTQILDPRCRNCTHIIDLKYGDW